MKDKGVAVVDIHKSLVWQRLQVGHKITFYPMMYAEVTHKPFERGTGRPTVKRNDVVECEDERDSVSENLIFDAGGRDSWLYRLQKA
jgi:hypothetical protein